MPDMSLPDEIQLAIADLVAGHAEPQRRAVLQLPQAVAPLLRALDASTADAIVPQLARVAARVLANPKHPGAPPQDALMAATHALTTLVAMACGALPLRQESLVTAFRELGDTGITILERRLIEAPPDQAVRLRALLADLRRPPDHQTPSVSQPTPPLPAQSVEEREPAMTKEAEAQTEPTTSQPQRPSAGAAERSEERVSPPSLDAEEPEPVTPKGQEAQTESAALEPPDHGPDERMASPRQDVDDTAEPATQVEAEPISRLPVDETELAEMPGDGVADLIHALTADPDPDARRAAAQALADLGPAAIPAIHQRLDAEIRAAHHDPSTAEPRAGTRADLVLTAARIGHPAALEPLLQALLDDPTPTVRRAAAGAIRVRAARQPEAVKPLLGSALDAAISPELAELVVDLLPDLTTQLLADLGSNDDRTQGRAIAVLVALACHDDALVDRIIQALTQPNLRARAAAAEILQRLGAVPQEPDLAVAYHLALGHDLAVAYHLATSRLEAIRPLGQPALPALRAACSLYDWRTAGPVAILMLKLRLDPADPLLDQIERALEAAAALPDEATVRTIGPPAKIGAAQRQREALQFTIPRDDDRQAARELLFRLRRMRERLRQAQEAASDHVERPGHKGTRPSSSALPSSGGGAA